MNTTVAVVFWAWIPVVAVLFRLVGPRQASLLAVLVGFLLLPRNISTPILALGYFPASKMTLTGVALMVGILGSDPKTLLKARPRLLDMPMIAYAFLPLASYASNRFQGTEEAIALFWTQFAGYLLPYVAGRLYFGDRDGPKRLSIAIVVAALLSVPIDLFEMVMGPSYYLAGLVYGIPSYGHMVLRLGGWRPEGFQTSGLEVGTWLALASTTAFWLWLRSGWIVKRVPSWGPTVVLTFVTLICRGVFGYMSLAIGLGAAGVTHLVRTRVLLIGLAIVPSVYVGTRLTGTWDGQWLVKLAKPTGRPDTIEYRLRAENAYIEKVFQHEPILGFGGVSSAIYDYWAKTHLWPDGFWIHQLRGGGVVGVSLFLLALFVMPIGLALSLPADRMGRDSPGALAQGLALFLIGHQIDSLLNMSYLTLTPFIGGSLVSLFRNRRAIRPELPTISSVTARTSSPLRVPLLATIVVLVVIEVVGQLGRTPTPVPPPTPKPSTSVSKDPQ